jgi:transcriptional regulator with XRE-family HTH domain
VSIGETLARARGQAGLSVHHVSERTRIRETIIRAIEQDDYSGCGGDFYARGHIRSIAHAVGADPEPLISQYDQIQGAPEPVPAADAFEPVRPVRVRPRRRVNWTVVATVAGVLVAMAVYLLIFGTTHIPASPRAAQSPAAKHHATPAAPGRHTPGQGSHQATPAATPHPAQPPVLTLVPASVTAFGPGGTAHGDNPQLAHFATDGRPGSAWHSDWYGSATFGNLQAGTGLLLDMGHQVTVTGAQITLGGAGGADLQLRAGNSATLAGLGTVAEASGAGGTVSLRAPQPVAGRYVLIWFTRLPRDQAGTFQVRVSGIHLSGRG